MSFGPPPWHAYSALLVTSTSLLMAVLVLRAGRRNPANQFFAFFMTLIGCNFAAQFIALGLSWPSEALFWQRLGILFLIWDPAVLVYFASLFPQRTFFARRRDAFSLLAATPIALTLIFLLDPEPFHYPPASWARVALMTYMASAYAYCLVIFLLSDPGPQSPARTRQAQALVLGFGVALLPRLGLVLDDLNIPSFDGLGSDPARTAGRIAVTWGSFAILWALSYYVSRNDPAGRPRGFQVPFVFRWTVLFLALTTVLWIVGHFLAQRYQIFAEGSLNLYYPFRWILFAFIVGYAIARYEVFDVEIRVKRFLRWLGIAGLAAGTFAASYFGIQAALSPLSEDPRAAAALIAVVLAVAIALLLRNAVGRATDLLLPRVAADEAYVRSRKLEVYGAHLEAAAAEGRLAGAPDPLLESVRERLGITPEEHEALENIIQRVAHPPLRLEERISTGEPLFGRYRILRRLDSGAFADVFLAEDQPHQRRVVVKRLHPRSGPDEGLLKSFLREAEVAGRIRHPNIVPVHEVLREGGDAYLVMDYVEGGNLAERLAQAGPLPVEDALALARDMLKGLQAAHDEGVFHRDLKPTNILLSPQGRALLADFGVAHVPSLEDTAGGSTAGRAPPGTVAYMAPEQALGRPVDGRADIYAVGAILYELATGRRLHPADGLGEFELRQRVARGVGRTQLQAAPEALRPVLARALSKGPADRYATPKEMLRALDRVRDGLRR